MRFVMVVVGESYFILFAAVWGAVGVAHRSRGGWCRGVAGIRNVTFFVSFRYVGWDRRVFCRYGSFVYRGSYVEFKFQVG